MICAVVYTMVYTNVRRTDRALCY